MTSFRIAYCTAFLVALAGGAAAEPPTHYVNQRDVALSLDTGGGPIERVFIWLSADDGRSWRQIDARRDGATLRFAADDSSLGVWIVLENKTGQSAAAPAPGDPPQLRVVIDTRPPTLQIREPRPAGAADEPLLIPITLADEHLVSTSARIFWRPAGEQTWCDAGVVEPIDGALRWLAPQAPDETIDICVVATDLAGNRAIDELRVVRTRAPKSSACLIDEPPPSPAAAATSQPVVEPPPTISAAIEAQAERLRRMGERFAATGQLELAAARYRDALELVPESPELSAELGSVLLRLNRFDEADHQLQRSVGLAADNALAVEQLALLAATQRRYDDAHQHLTRLIALQPGVATHYLRLGDVEHRLGRRARACVSWRKALETASDAETRARAEQRLRQFGPE